ncbi:inositol phosphorylceramide synthase, partial [Streptomyces sp. NPDC058964]
GARGGGHRPPRWGAPLVGRRAAPHPLGCAPPLLVLSMVSVIHGYVRTTRLWEPAAVPALRPEPQPEPA